MPIREVMPKMLLKRLQAEDGFGLVELIAAVAVLTIGLLALVAGYGSAYVAFRQASTKTSANAIAATELELYRAVPYASLGLDSTQLSNAETTDTVYASDHSSLDDPNALTAGTDVSSSSCTPLTAAFGSSSATVSTCVPIQSVTDGTGHTFRVETFIRDVQDSNSFSVSWTERIVTVIIRDPKVSGSPIVLETATAFDRGP
jgi:type II secretory pathway pseudopilin PulG